MLRRMFPLLLVGLFVLAPQPSAETKTIRIEVRQVFGGSQSPDDARVAAIARAKREALEEAGTYLESLTVVRNAQVKKDEILALASGVLQTQIVTEEPFVEGSALDWSAVYLRDDVGATAAIAGAAFNDGARALRVSTSARERGRPSAFAEARTASRRPAYSFRSPPEKNHAANST
ncbi:MAG: hypothetical protein IIA14_08305, partial [SAR324 cluster bacterium]|nr:hypothetical protein [SAR324 cluster bacterium]